MCRPSVCVLNCSFLPDTNKLLDVVEQTLYLIFRQVHKEVLHGFYFRVNVTDGAVRDSVIFTCFNLCDMYFEDVSVYLFFIVSHTISVVFMYLSSWYNSTSTF